MKNDIDGSVDKLLRGFCACQRAKCVRSPRCLFVKFEEPQQLELRVREARPQTTSSSSLAIMARANRENARPVYSETTHEMQLGLKHVTDICGDHRGRRSLSGTLNSSQNKRAPLRSSTI
jgi:hypothetical protein